MKVLAEIRNAAVHGVVPVTRQLAERAIAIAEGNVYEFMGWLPTLPEPDREKYEAMPWTQVKRTCGLDFIPGEGSR